MPREGRASARPRCPWKRVTMPREDRASARPRCPAKGVLVPKAEGGPSVCSAKMPGERRDYAEGRGRAAGGPREGRASARPRCPWERVTMPKAEGGPSVCSANVPVEPRQRRAEGRPREGRASARPLRPWERVSRLIYYFKGKPGHLNQTILRHLFRLDMANRQRFRQDLYELDYYEHRHIFLYKRHLSAFVYPSNHAEI